MIYNPLCSMYLMYFLPCLSLRKVNWKPNGMLLSFQCSFQSLVASMKTLMFLRGIAKSLTSNFLTLVKNWYKAQFRLFSYIKFTSSRSHWMFCNSSDEFPTLLDHIFLTWLTFFNVSSDKFFMWQDLETHHQEYCENHA